MSFCRLETTAVVRHCFCGSKLDTKQILALQQQTPWKDAQNTGGHSTDRYNTFTTKYPMPDRPQQGQGQGEEEIPWPPLSWGSLAPFLQYHQLILNFSWPLAEAQLGAVRLHSKTTRQHDTTTGTGFVDQRDTIVNKATLDWNGRSTRDARLGPPKTRGTGALSLPWQRAVCNEPALGLQGTRMLLPQGALMFNSPGWEQAGRVRLFCFFAHTRLFRLLLFLGGLVGK